ncbi:hypothetical protein pb186bvf_008784 [Paramecium bursaria]
MDRRRTLTQTPIQPQPVVELPPLTPQRQYLGDNPEVVCFILALEVDRLQVELERLREEKNLQDRKARDDARKLTDLQEDMSKQKSKMENAQKGLQQQLKERDQEIDELNQKLEEQWKARQKLTNQHDEEIKELKFNHEQELQNLTDKFQTQIKELEEDLDDLNLKLRQQKLENDERVQQLNKKQTSDNQGGLVKFQLLEAENQKLQAAHQAEINKLNQQYQLLQQQNNSLIEEYRSFKSLMNQQQSSNNQQSQQSEVQGSNLVESQDQGINNIIGRTKINQQKTSGGYQQCYYPKSQS